MVVTVDGRRAAAVDGLHVGFAERLAAHPDPVGCVDCGGPAPCGSALTRIERYEGGLSAWRRCPDCVAERDQGAGAQARAALEVHGLGPAEHAPPGAIRYALGALGLPYWHRTRPGGEEFSAPVERWSFPAASVWAGEFRDRVRAASGRVR